MPPRRRPSSEPDPSQGSEELRALQSGRLTPDAYIELRLERALARLGGMVSSEQKAELRELLREQLCADPVLEEYLRRALSRLPDPSTAD